MHATGYVLPPLLWNCVPHEAPAYLLLHKQCKLSTAKPSKVLQYVCVIAGGNLSDSINLQVLRHLESVFR
jgi:hypothetical protein